MRILSGRAANLSHEFMDEETPLSQTAVKVTVVDGLGQTVVNAADATTTDNDTWNYSIPASDLDLGKYAVTWAGDNATDIDYFEVVANFMFSVPEARASDDYLSDVSAFPATDIVGMREVVEKEFERITGRSFTTRAVVRKYVCEDYRATELPGLILDARSILSLSINGTPIADSDLSNYGVTATGDIFVVGNPQPPGWEFEFAGPQTSPWRRGDAVTARIEYGFQEVPADIKRVGMIRLRHLLAAESSAIPDRAITWQPQEGGSFRLATPGMQGFQTGIPEVDATLKNYTLDSVINLYGMIS